MHVRCFLFKSATHVAASLWGCWAGLGEHKQETTLMDHICDILKIGKERQMIQNIKNAFAGGPFFKEY